MLLRVFFLSDKQKKIEATVDHKEERFKSLFNITFYCNCIHVYEERRAVSCYEGTQKMQKIMNTALLSKGLLSMIVGHR